MPRRLAIAESLLAFVGYAGALEQPAGALAHVDKRLVEIARALAVRPHVLALDEPAAGLDAKDTEAIGDVLRKVADTGVAVILIEHDMQLVMEVSDRVVVLDAGAKIAEGAASRCGRRSGRAQGLSRRGATRRTGTPASGDEGRDAPRRQRPVRRIRRAPSSCAASICRSQKAKWSRSSAPMEPASPRLMRALSGLNRPVGGEILLLGERIDDSHCDPHCGAWSHPGAGRPAGFPRTQRAR